MVLVAQKANYTSLGSRARRQGLAVLRRHGERLGRAHVEDAGLGDQVLDRVFAEHARAVRGVHAHGGDERRVDLASQAPLHLAATELRIASVLALLEKPYNTTQTT